jgi:glycerol kinase
MNEYILTIDEGTTSARAIIFDHSGEIISLSQKEFTQYYPHPGWIEQDPIEIWTTTMEVIGKCMMQSGLAPEQIKAIGITNQRETVVVWDKNTGTPVYNDIVWGDRRTAPYCDELKAAGYEPMVKSKTGLIIDAYFSGTKIKWILDNVEGAREAAEKGDLIFSNIDGWILWNLTKGEAHMTDYSNASRTLLFNIHTLDWDDELLELLTIPKSMCPEVKESSGHFANTKVHNLFEGREVPIEGIIGDQMSATFGQCCFEKGQCKITWGTAGTMTMNTGDEAIESQNGMLTTIGWGLNGEVQYLLEGTVYNAGSSVQWLRDEMKFLESSGDSEYFAAKSTLPLGTCYVVPSFSGLGAPYWDSYARGTIFGMSRGTAKNDIIRATLDSIGYQTRDILASIAEDMGQEIKLLRVDGGACNNNIITQFTSDILGIDVERPSNVETTAAGAAYLAGLSVGYWKDEADILNNRKVDKVFKPEMSAEQRESLYAGWKNCVKALMVWSEGEKASK